MLYAQWKKKDWPLTRVNVCKQAAILEQLMNSDFAIVFYAHFYLDKTMTETYDSEIILNFDFWTSENTYTQKHIYILDVQCADIFQV